MIPQINVRLDYRKAVPLRDYAIVPPALQQEEAAANAFRSPAAGMARICIARPFTLEWQMISKVLIDGQLAERPAPETFLIVQVSQGLHRVMAKTDVTATTRIRAEAKLLSICPISLNFG